MSRPTMTKKHFIALAQYMKDDQWRESQLSCIVRFCRSQNPAFMEGRFKGHLRRECGPSGGEVYRREQHDPS